MEVSDKELREMLNKAWEMGIEYGVWDWDGHPARRYRRHRDVSKIIKEAEKAKEEQP